MKTTKNYELMEVLAEDLQCIVIPMPKFKAYKGDKIDMVEQLQTAVTQAITAVNAYFKRLPAQANYDNADKALTEAMKKCASAKIYIQKDFIGQIDLDF
jgi:hypothetical protein